MLFQMEKVIVAGSDTHARISSDAIEVKIDVQSWESDVAWNQMNELFRQKFTKLNLLMSKSPSGSPDTIAYISHYDEHFDCVIPLSTTTASASNSTTMFPLGLPSHHEQMGIDRLDSRPVPAITDDEDARSTTSQLSAASTDSIAKVGFQSFHIYFLTAIVAESRKEIMHNEDYAGPPSCVYVYVCLDCVDE